MLIETCLRIYVKNESAVADALIDKAAVTPVMPVDFFEVSVYCDIINIEHTILIVLSIDIKIINILIRKLSSII